MAEDKKVTKKEASKKAATKAKPKKTEAKPAKSKAKTAAKAAPKKAADKPAAQDKPAKGKKKAGAPTKRAPLAPKSYQAKWGEVKAEWKIIDATNQTLGRLSSNVAKLLSGKHKPQYTPNADTGDFVVVVNAEKVKLTGAKLTDKWYHYHTGYAGGIKSFTPKDLFEKHPERVIERAVFGMLPKNHLGRRWYKKLKVYAGPEHPHTAQKPEAVEVRP